MFFQDYLGEPKVQGGPTTVRVVDDDWFGEGVLQLALPPPHCVTLESRLWLFLGLPALRSELHHWLSWVSVLSIIDLWIFQPPKSCEPIPSN